MSVELQDLLLSDFISTGAYRLAVLTCVVCVGLQLVLLCLRLWMSRLETIPSRPSINFKQPTYSVHLAIHNEPPAVVIKTLRALAAQDWPAAQYEVIVIDNNTVDPLLWQPVAATCTELGSQFRFYHRMGVIGAKAGALNIALLETRQDASHIVTVDADYVTDPQFLMHAAAALRDTGADYVQFPQAYVGCDRVGAGVDAELEEYFRTNAQMADVAEAVLLTGTLCVISAPALRAAGGWSGHTITEDADMGVRLCQMGFSGRFIGKIVGRGVLPFSLIDLERQRHRWASGNLQTLIAHAPSILSVRGRLGWRRRGAILSQLTAWLNLSLLPVAVLLVVLMTERGGDLLVDVAAASVCLTFADIVGRLAWRGRHDASHPAVVAAAICNRVALAPVSACATLAVLLGRPLTFSVTDKSGVSRGRGTRMPLGSFILFIASAIVLPAAIDTSWLAMLAVLTLLTPFPAAIATARTLDRYRLHVAPSLTGV